jgi:acyl-CoA thioesterase-1
MRARCGAQARARRVWAVGGMALAVCLVGCGDRDAPASAARSSGSPAGTVEARSSTAARGARLAPSARSARRPRLVVLGDSLTAGLGLDPADAFPAVLQARLQRAGYDIEVVNAGVSGDTTAGGLRRLDWVLDEDVRILVVALGGNDGLRGLPVDEMRRNLDAIIRRARARGIAVVLAGMEAPPNLGEPYTSRFRETFRQLAREHRVAFVPFLLEGVAGDPALNQSDGIHPNAAGARRVADNLWGALEPLVRELGLSRPAAPGS